MEIRQLEFFVAACDKGSFNQAAECLYTTQPNVSKAIAALEKELGRPLFKRTSRGIQLTPYGETVREYAHNVLNNIILINSMANHNRGRKFTIATYPSNMIARLLTDFYNEWGGSYIIEHQEGTVGETSDRVAQGISEIGMVYVSQKQLNAFQHILNHKKLYFEALAAREICVYIGPNHPRFNDGLIDFSELSDLNFVRGIRDFFSMDHHLEQVSLGAISTEKINYTTYTNSDHLTLDLLLHTDVCALGIDFMIAKYKQHDIKTLRIKNCEPILSLGYISLERNSFSEAAVWFLEHFKRLI